MLENVDNVRLSLLGGSAIAARVGQLLIGTTLGIGFAALGNENVRDTATDWMLGFKAENLGLYHVSNIRFFCFPKRTRFRCYILLYFVVFCM